MAAYRSNLNTLHKLRIAARDQQRHRVADGLRAEAALAEQAYSVEAERQALAQSQRAMRSGEVNVSRLLEVERYEVLLSSQAEHIAQQRQLVASEIERRRADLAAAEQQVRVIEKLDDRRRREFEREQARRDQSELDEVATNQFLRKHNTFI